ncbi:MAG: hypothetical protein MIO92_07600 [Methanosarcinaceae archaeon]|nr:hypothetical protein [Methanosarcinaceae archaeon]
MASEIEKMNRSRKNMIKGIFFATIIAFIIFMLPTFAPRLVRSKQSQDFIFICSSIFWLLSLLVFGVINSFFKRKLRENPLIYHAVYDDRITLGWLKAYRFSFFAAFITSIFWWHFHELYARWSMTGKGSEREILEFILNQSFRFPNGPFFVLYIALLSLYGSYLFFSREVKNG